MIFESTTRKDAIDLLKQDHREVEALFREFESADDDATKVELAGRICGELVVHAEIEERIFYPAAREALPEDKEDLVSEAKVEHTSLKNLIADIDASSPRDELFEANVKVLSEYVKHHVREEETELMPAVRRTGIDLAALGEKLVALKQTLKSSQRPAGRGGSGRVRVPMPASGRASPSRKGAAKSTRARSGGAARKTGGRASGSRSRTGSGGRASTSGSRSRKTGARATASNARSRTTATRKRTAARKQGVRKSRGR
jgi:hemerythrin superfamily protein